MSTPKKLGRAPRVTIKVTSEAIAFGVRADSSHCVIAEAIKAQLAPHAKWVAIDLQTIRWTDMAKRERYTYLTPRPFQQLLVDFDQGIMPDPCSVVLRDGQVTAVPDRTRERKARREKKTGKPARAALRVPRGGAGQGSSVPEVVGGKPPPVAALSNIRGRRRAFGLRNLRG